MIYRIAKWSETFETADSRRFRSLEWVSLPVGFSSHGYQSMLDDFGDDAPAIYGAWCALVALAATMPTRGTLCSSRGVPLSLATIARQTFFPLELFQRLFEWAQKPEIGWIVVDSAPPSRHPVVTQPPPSDHPAATQPLTGLPDQTRPNLTQPDQTRPDHNDRRSIVGRSLEVSLVDQKAAVEVAKRVAEVLYPTKIDSERLVRYCVVAIAADRRGVLLEAAHAAKAPNVRKKSRYWEAAVETAVKEAGFDFEGAFEAVEIRRKTNGFAAVQ